MAISTLQQGQPLPVPLDAGPWSGPNRDNDEENQPDLASSSPSRAQRVLRRVVHGPATDPARRAAGTVGVAGRHGRVVPVGPRGIRVGQQLLFGGRSGRDQELESLFFRVIGFVKLHNRRQAPRRPLGHGNIGPHFRPLFVEHPRPSGPGGGGGGGHSVRHRPPLGIGRSRPAGGDRHGLYPRGGVDVPVQQP